MNPSVVRLLPFLLASVLLTWAAPSPAATFMNTFATVRAVCDGCPDLVRNQGTGSADASVEAAGITATAGAGAGIGWLRGRASVVVEDDPDDATGRGVANAQAEFEDDFVIDGGALNGTTGFMDFSINISGSTEANASSDLTIDPFPSAYASLRTSLDIEGRRCCNLSLEDFADVDTPGAGFLAGTLEFEFGETYTLFVRAIGSATAQGEGLGIVDFSSTVEWGGISEIRDEQGNVVTSFTVASGSGVDWAQPVVAPVPEPMPLLLLGALGLAIGWRGRGRRS